MLQVLAVIFLILSVSIARAETPEVAAQAELVADLQTRDTLLDAEIRKLGSGRGGTAAAAGLTNRMDVLEEKIVRLTRVSEELAAGNDDIDSLRQQAADEPVITLTDLAREGVEGGHSKGTKKLFEMAGKKDGAKAMNPATLSDKTFEYLGKYAIREINEWTIRDMVRLHEVQLVDVLRLINTLRDAQNQDRRNLARVQELRQQKSAIFTALERERAKLTNMQKN
jgi:hypothetical protein